MVDEGDARREDLIGNNAADTAADLGRLLQHDAVISARRALIRARRHWYPNKFMVAISRTEVNHDGHGGTALDAMTWDKGGIVTNTESLLFEPLSTMRHSQVHSGFWTALGVACPLPLSHMHLFRRLDLNNQPVIATQSQSLTNASSSHCPTLQPTASTTHVGTHPVRPAGAKRSTSTAQAGNP